jgi:hypothetical protein
VQYILSIVSLARSVNGRRSLIVHLADIVFKATPAPEIDLGLLVEPDRLVVEEGRERIDLFTDIDVEALIVDEISIKYPVEVQLKVLYSVAEGRAGRRSLKLKLSAFSREEELGFSKVLKTGRADVIENGRPDVGQVLGLKIVANTLLTRVTTGLNLTTLHLMRL